MKAKAMLGAPVWPHWIMCILLFALLSEYLRLVLTTDTPGYRIAVTAVLGIGFVVSLLRLLEAMRGGRAGQSHQ